MNEDVYEYPPLYRFISLAAPLFIISSAVYLLLWPLLNDEPLAENYILVVAVGLPSAVIFALSIHFMYPTIVVRQGEFKLTTQLYESDWYRWDQLTRIRTPAIEQWITKIYAVGCKDLDIWFLVIGYAQGVFTRGFLIHPNMRNGERLLRLMIKERPELFD